MVWEVELSLHQGQKLDEVGKDLNWVALRASTDLPSKVKTCVGLWQGEGMESDHSTLNLRLLKGN